MKMLIMSIIFALILGSGTPASASYLIAASSPSVRCSIVLRDWCIANSPSSVSMVDLPYRRLWIIKSPIGMQHGPLVIVSDKTCNNSTDSGVSFVSESKRRVAENGEIYEATFRIGKGGCKLRFQWPAGAADSYSYQEFMVFNVLVGKAGGADYTSLYRVYNKYRCHGVFIDKSQKCQ